MDARGAPLDLAAQTGDRGLHRWLPGIVCVLWCCYSVNGFRGWWVPITLSDSDAGSGMRQVLFLGSATAVAGAVWMTGRSWETIRTHWRFALLAFWLALTMVYSEAPATTLKRSIVFACGAVATAGMMSLVRDPMRFVGRTLAFIPAAAAWVSLAWWLVLPPSITTNPARPGLAGVSNHPNTLAPVLSIGLVMSISLLPSTRIEHIARIMAALGCVIALTLTGSVTSLGFAAVGVSLLLALVLPTYWRALGVLLGLGTLSALLVAGVSSVSESMLNSVGRDSSLSGRDELWKQVSNRIGDAPIFGKGWGAFWVEGRGRELVSSWNPRQSHNAYLDVLLDLGLVGALVCLVTLGPAYWLAVKRWRFAPEARERRTAAGLLAVATGLLLVYALQQSFIGKVDSFAFFTVMLGSAALVATNDSRARERGAPDPAMRVRASG
ncbi:MAG: O-antigen ligase family protein [Planctomycetota bacterium]